MKEAIATHHHSFPKQQLSTNQHHFASIQSSIFVPMKLFLLLLPNSHENEMKGNFQHKMGKIMGWLLLLCSPNDGHSLTPLSSSLPGKLLGYRLDHLSLPIHLYGITCVFSLSLSLSLSLTHTHTLSLSLSLPLFAHFWLLHPSLRMFKMSEVLARTGLGHLQHQLNHSMLAFRNNR
jgi:hypothetical protein